MALSKVVDNSIEGLAASKLTGTIADARFPATLPAASGVNLTALNATNLGSGTVPDARFPATLPAGSGVNLTALNATNLGSGTVPTARLGTGTASSSTFLRGDQTYAEAGGGSWNLIGTAEASNSASLTITGLDSTYDTYAIAMSALVPQTNGKYVWLRVGDSSGIDEGGGDYAYSTFNKLDSTGALSSEYATSYHAIPVSYDVGNTSGYGYGGMYFLHCPGDSGVAPLFSGTYTNVSAAGRFSMGMGTGARRTAITLDRIQCLFATGNITSGRFSVYGIAHA